MVHFRNQKGGAYDSDEFVIGNKDNPYVKAYLYFFY